MAQSLPQAGTVAELGEFALIDHIIAGLPSSPAVSLGPGDDAAVFLVNGSAVTSVDIFVEGVHFRRDWSEPFDIGRKCVAAAYADLEAMGAVGVALLIGLALPGDVPQLWAGQFSAGVRAEADRAGAALVGGDISSASQIMVSVTAVGQSDGLAPVTRAGARPDQVVAVCGRLGWAGAGLTALARGFRSPKAVVDTHRCPRVPYGQGRVAALAGASAMIDVSDGLLADLGHIAVASNVTIALDSKSFDVAEPVRAVAAATGRDPLDFVLTGGEDHALAATFRLGDVPEKWAVVGQVLPPPEDETAPAVLVDGIAWPSSAPGYSHF
ncbi:MAG: thiamine-phosphate kinase [Propionibacteriaceae bacterium]|nr:thiamine-phosphate kinase [Propionibacteriaceae bacterium]